MANIFRGPLYVKTWWPELLPPDNSLRTWTANYTLAALAPQPPAAKLIFREPQWVKVRWPEYASDQRSWTWSQPLPLTAVSLPPGKQVYDLPPFGKYVRQIQLDTWGWRYVLELIGKDRLPPGKQVYDLTPPPADPYQRDLRAWEWWYDLQLIGRDRLPAGGRTSTALPPPVSWYREWALNLQQTTLAPPPNVPIGEQVFDRPPPVYWYQTWALNLLQGTLQPAPVFPFNQFDWPLPVAPPRLPQSWTWQYNLNLIGQDALVVGEQVTDLPPRAPPRLDQTWTWQYNNNLIGKDALPPGENISDLWPRPQAEPATRTWTYQYNLNLIGQDALPIGVQVDERPPPVQWYREWALNLQQTTLRPIAFVQTDWPLPIQPFRLPQGWALNLLQTTLQPTAAPFSQTDWQRPVPPPRLLQGWTWQYNLNLIGQDQLPTGEQVYDRPTIVQWYREWAQNLLLTTLRPIAQAFVQTDWPVPRAPAPILQSWTFQFNPNLIGQDAVTVGEQVYDLAPRPPPRLEQTWTFTFPPTLRGQDQLPVGENVSDQPPLRVVWYRGWEVNLVLSTLQGQDRLPTGLRISDRPNLGPQPAAFGWAASYNLNLIGQDTRATGSQVWERPPVPSWYRDWSQNLLQTTLSPAAVAFPFNQYDWPLPRAPQQSALGFTAFFNPNLVGKDQLPVGENVYALTPSGVLATDARSWVYFTSLALSSSLGVPIGVKIYDLAPRAYPPAPPSWTFQFNPNLIGQDALPPGRTITDRPPPVDWRRGAEFFLSPSFLPLAQFPFNQFNWPLRPGPLQPDRGFSFSFPLWLVGRDRFPPGARSFDLTPRGVNPADYRTWSSGNQITLLPPSAVQTTMRTFIFG